MSSPESLELLLQTLVNTPEEDKRALTRSAISLLREVCNNHLNSNYSRFQEIAKRAREILDKILIGQITEDSDSDGDEEAFLESGEFSEVSAPLPRQVEEVSLQNSALYNLYNFVKKWNLKMEPWFQINIPEESSQEKSIIQILNNACALRTNIISATNAKFFDKKDFKRYEKYWKLWSKEISSYGYEIYPERFGHLDTVYGEAIYTCSTKLNERKISLLRPGLKKGDKVFLNPITLVSLPTSEPFPDEHPNKDLLPAWRAILGELELLLKQLELQSFVMCAIESVTKSRIQPFTQNKEVIINEIKRRGDALKCALKQEKSIYRLATNYWRVEECFWSIFHYDGRPYGYSFFDRIRRRVQKWHPSIRKSHNLYIRNFNAHRDSLASTNKYLGNIILETKEGVPPGTILRELRPATIVKDNKLSRLLKGRVIAT